MLVLSVPEPVSPKFHFQALMSCDPPTVLWPEKVTGASLQCPVALKAEIGVSRTLTALLSEWEQPLLLVTVSDTLKFPVPVYTWLVLGLSGRKMVRVSPSPNSQNHRVINPALEMLWSVKATECPRQLSVVAVK